MSEAYTTVIGLEVHVQLATASKLFCRCSTRFGAEPNTQTCAVCIGMPGTLPVMNREAFRLALKTAVALNCEIPSFTKWDRKQYYYPDLPKAYQISQYDLPLSEHGYLEISDPKDQFAPKRVGIIRAHLEEDAGKSIHDEVAGKGDSLIDLNRTGTPLLEIVSEPDLRSSAEARVFLSELKLLLTYIGVSDCNMQEGSLRVDANVNLHIDASEGTVATPIVEVKNMNSFRAVERALDFEAERQYREWQETGKRLGQAPKQTRGWDDAAGVTRGQRSKEESSDYRYFPDPDLVPVTVTPEEVQQVRQSLGELPAALRKRLESDYGLSAYDADVLVNQGPGMIKYYLETLAGEPITNDQTNIQKIDPKVDPKKAANIITQHVFKTLNENPNVRIKDFPIESGTMCSSIGLIESGVIPTARFSEYYDYLYENPRTDPKVIVTKLGFKKIDDSEIESLCRELLAANPKTVADVKAGNVKAIGSLIGQAKQKNPNVDPNRFRETCLKLIQEGA